MDRARRNKQFCADLRMMYFAGKFEFHFAGQHNDQFVRLMAEVFPAPAWRIRPDFAAKATLGPIGQNLAGVWHRHRKTSFVCRYAFAALHCHVIRFTSAVDLASLTDLTNSRSDPFSRFLPGSRPK